MNPQGLLAIRQRHLNPDEIRRIGSSLYWQFKMNAMIARERLAGDGYAILHRGETDVLAAIAETLKTYGIEAWILPLPVSAFDPIAVRDLAAFKDHVRFRHGDSEIRLNMGDNVLAVLGGEEREPVHGEGADEAVRLADRYRNLIRNGPSLAVFIMRPEEQTATGLIMRAPLTVTAGKDEQKRRYGVSIHNLIGHISRLASPFVLVPVREIQGLETLPATPSESDEEAHVPEGGAFMMESLLAAMHLQSPLSALCPSNAPWLEKPLEEEAAPKRAAQSLSSGIPGAAVMTGEALAGRIPLNPASKTGEAAFPLRETLPPPPPFGTSRFGLMANRKQLLVWGVTVPAFFIAVKVLPPATLASLFRFAEHYGYDKGILHFIAAAVLFVMSFRYLKYKRIMEDTPTSKARSVAMGMAEVKGNAIRIYNLLSPITMSPCVYYCVRKYRRNSKDQWNQYAHIESGAIEFDLQDETGRITVDPFGATFVGLRKDTFTGGILTGMLKGVPLPIPSNEKWTEEFIFEKAPIYVLGFVRPEDRQHESLGERLKERLRMLKSDPKAMMAFDENGDGRIDQAEWEKVREASEQELIREALHQKEDGGAAAQKAVICKPKGWGSPFIIGATRMEEKLTRRYGLLAIACFAGALIAVGWGVQRILS